MAWNKNVNTNAPSKSFIANLLKAGVAISICAILFACGDEVTNENITQIVQENMAVVADVSKLPDCTSENEGQQALVKDEPSPRICVDGKWFATFSDYTDKLDDFKCSAEKLKDGSGLKILCNGDSIGVVLNGTNGSNGVNGAQGIQGEKGDKGDTGAQGIQGEKGDKGDTGAQGIQGEKGDKGDTGAQGIQGEKGDKGDTGAQGVQGEKGGKGDTGAQGIQGEKGDKGDTGAQGIQGEKGDKGDTGEQGIQGEKGDKGDDCSVVRVDDVITINCGENNVALDINEIRGLCPIANEGMVVKKHISNYQDSVYSCKNGFWEGSIELTYGTLIDSRDQKVYKTVTIGSQIWMAENLNYYDSIVYPGIQGRSKCDSCAKYGRLYTASAAYDSAGTFSTNAKGCGKESMKSPCRITLPIRGICPEGWHIPTRDEWYILYNNVGQSSYALQAKNMGWSNATDIYGFSALPAGCWESLNTVVGGSLTDFWAIYGKNGSYSYLQYACYAESRSGSDKFFICLQEYWEYLVSVRCLKDDD
ncbi:FISUMP domain-containing protein [Fibrobacter sp.]